MNIETKLKGFHAFEWLRGEALKGNTHAELLAVEISALKQYRPQLKAVAVAWLERARVIDDKFSAANPGQALVAKEAFINCAEEVEEIIKQLP